MAKSPGFLVWNPARSHPTVQHETFARAHDEAKRLREANPDERFFVMAPVMEKRHAEAAQAFSDGKAVGYAEARSEVMQAEARSDQLLEDKRAVERRLAAFDALAREIEEHQAAAADCLLWFDGFNAAHAHKDRWERPSTPDREKLRRLNAALQVAVRASRDQTLDEEIPF